MSLRDQAIEKLRESFDLLTKAGIAESLQDLLYKEQWYADFINGKDKEYVEYYHCAVCNDKHILSLSIKKDQSIQYSLSIEIEECLFSLSFIAKIKLLYRYIKDIFFNKTITKEFLLSHNDLTSFKDMIKKIP